MDFSNGFSATRDQNQRYVILAEQATPVACLMRVRANHVAAVISLDPTLKQVWRKKIRKCS